MASTKPAEFLRVTLKAQAETIYDMNSNGSYKMNPDGSYSYTVKELEPLGFAQDYTPQTKGFEKKKDTQDRWAYGYYNHTDSCFEKDGQMYMRRHSWTQEKDPNERTQIVTDTIVPEELQPRIIRNDPLDGFRLLKSVSRYSTSNKLWRVLDPRGFQLEISTANLEDLIMEGEIIKGWISGQCQWVGKTLKRVKEKDLPQ